MRVAMYYNNHDIRLEEKPLPKIDPGEMLMRIDASGICGSDLMEWYRLHKAPLVLGHEVAGVVVEVGEGVTKYKVGDRITAAHHVPCNTCHYCLSGHSTVCNTLRSTNFDPGGFAEYVRLPAINVDRGVLVIPPEVTLEEATFTEPLACVLRGQRAAGLQPGETVLVIGSGLAGLLYIHLARALGAGHIVATDINEFRLKSARQFGADLALPASEDVPARLREINDGRLADRVIVCAAHTSAIDQALRSIERGGTVLLFAPTQPQATVPISVNDLFWRNDITITTTYAGSPADCATALALIQSKRVRVGEMITHRLGLAETGLGFQLVGEGKDCLKVIIEPQK
jgi:L-iditol 2-dehydrogenase